MAEDLSYSVLMSVYQKETPRYLKASIQSMLDQTVKPGEFVVVKDGPLTGELEIVLNGYRDEFPRLFHFLSFENNRGLGPALAAGIQACRYEFVARMDSDDVSDPRRCEVQLGKFREMPALDMVGCLESEFAGSIREVVSVHRVPESQDEIVCFMKRRNAVLHPTVIYRKSAVLACGNYSDVPFFEDYDLFARMLQNGARCCNVQEPLYYLRVGPDFYRRRGGLRYLRREIRFRLGCRRSGFLSRKDFMIGAGAHAAVCLLPNRLRAAFYLKFLRS